MSIRFAMSTEESPLLVSSPISNRLPAISDGLRAVQSRGGVRNFSFPEWYPRTLPTVATQTAYHLLIILRWELVLRGKTFDANDIWERLDEQIRIIADINALHDKIIFVWNNFIKEHRTQKEIEDVLWCQFPVETNGDRLLRGMLCFCSQIFRDCDLNFSFL